jgi:signal transduction histidine kinase/CheY-like chemotaxis protein
LARDTKNPTAQSGVWLAGDGEMGARIRAFDWAKTPLGPGETWSPALRATLGVMLANRFPLLLWWGPDYISIYNDAYVPILGKKHPNALGLPVRECWSEIWGILKPLIDTPYNGGPSTWIEDFELHIQRLGIPEETHFTVAYSPVPDDTTSRGIGGVLATVHEITQKVVAERRVEVLRDLGVQAVESSAEETCRAAAEILSRHGKDVPFALLYLVDADGRQARLAAAAGVEPGQDVSPLVARLDPIEPEKAWPLAAVFRRRQTVTVTNLGARFEVVPPGPWADPPHSAVVVPIRSNKANEVAGLIVAGVSAHLTLDELYRDFYELMASQIGTAIAKARAWEDERKRTQALAEIDRAKTAFFSNVSHEFRTPLTLMLGPLEDLKQEFGRPQSPLSIPQYQQLDLVHRNGMRLLKLTNTLLDFARIEAGRMQAAYEPIDLAAFTAELASVFRSAVEKAGLKLTVNCSPLREPAFVDREMWEKIVLNLVSNAFKFTFEGTISVEIRPTSDGAAAELVVRDTGTGIPAAELPRLFERFHRIEGARGRTFEGSGIGLALVQELVKLHGGAIDVASELGRGSRFTVRLPFGTAHLPRERVAAAASPSTVAGSGAGAYVLEALRWLPQSSDDIALTSAPAAAPAADAARGDGAFVILADDNADLRDYVRRLLEHEGYRVEAFADGAAALAAARRQRPDLIVSDVMMPKLDGFGLLRELRQDEELRELPIVLLSARAGEEARVEGLDAGADDYVSKPFSARELLARVRANLQSARVRKQAERHRELLVNELNHRVKNTLTAVQSLAMQTLRNAQNLDDGRRAFDARLIALSKAHDILVRENWEAAGLREIVAEALAAHGGAMERRLQFDGPDIRLRPKVAVALSMALHELATNAAKYGALSNQAGHVAIAWSIAQPSFQLRWTEAGGPPVVAPRRRGFGSRLIEQGLSHEFGGQVDLAFETSGVICTIRARLDEVRAVP